MRYVALYVSMILLASQCITGHGREGFESGLDRSPTFQPPVAGLRSQKPLLAKITLSKDGSKSVIVAIDESVGTGMGYDSLCVDMNLNGAIEKNERNRLKRQGFTCISELIALPAALDTGKYLLPVSVAVHGQALPSYWSFNISLRIKGINEYSRWYCNYTLPAKRAKSLDQAPLVNLAETPRLQLNLVAGSNNSKTLAIEMVLVNSPVALVNDHGISINPHYTDDSPIAELVVKDASGRVVTEKRGNLSMFSYG